MVAQATTTLLPTLSKADKLRLNLYFVTGQSIEALALELLNIHRRHESHLSGNAKPSPFAEALTTENTALAPILSSPPDTSSLRNSVTASLPPSLPDSYDLASWTLSETIAPHIAYRRAESLERRKESALQQLDTILATSDSPIEKRRAATTMLRMLTNQLYRNRVSPSPSSPERRGGGGPALGERGGGGSISTSRNTPSPLTANSSPPSSHLGPSGTSVASSPSSSDPRPSASSAASSPHSVTASLSHSVTSPPPPPDTTAKSVIGLALHAIMTPKDLKARAALEPFLAPQATINHEPILNLESQLSAITPQREVTQIVPDDSRINHSPGPPETRSSICSLYQNGSNNRYQITLIRADSGPHPNSWLISAINPITDTS